MVREIDDSVSVIGTADMMYKLSLPLEINAYSRLRVLLDQLEASTSTVQICLYEELDTFTLELCPSRCFTLTRGSKHRATSLHTFQLPNPGYPHGGIIVREIDDSVSIIGSVDMMYTLSLPLEINTYSRLRVLLDQLEGSTSTAQICLYEEFDTFTLELCPSRCFTLTRGSNDFFL